LCIYLRCTIGKIIYIELLSGKAFDCHMKTKIRFLP